MRTLVRTTLRTLAFVGLTLGLLSATDAVGQTAPGDMTSEPYGDNTKIMSLDRGETTRLILVPVFMVGQGEAIALSGISAEEDTTTKAIGVVQEAVNEGPCSVAKVFDAKTPEGAMTKAGVEEYLEQKGTDAYVRGWKVLVVDCPSYYLGKD